MSIIYQKIPVVPGFEKSFHSWTLRFCQKNLWRFHHGMELEDLFQESLLVFIRVQKKYLGVEQKHLMSLFQVSLVNKINTMSLKFSANTNEDLVLVDGVECYDLRLLDVLLSAPQEVKDLLQEIAKDGSELLLGGRISNKRVRDFFEMPRKKKPADLLRNMLKNSV